jgi:DNA invertase Pin-like site-specific DNA recombinase
MTGYYSEIFFQTKGVRYIAIADDFDSDKGGNEIAPFKNILNDMYARDISKKIRNAKPQRAKQGLFISGQAPYGYRKDPP